MNENDFDKLILAFVTTLALTIIAILTSQSLEIDRCIAMAKAGLQQCESSKFSTPLWQKECK